VYSSWFAHASLGAGWQTVSSDSEQNVLSIATCGFLRASFLRKAAHEDKVILKKNVFSLVPTL
jgi:hypothetical protein